MAEKIKKRGAVLSARGNQRGGMTAEAAQDNFIAAEKYQLDSSSAARKAKEYKKSEYELRKAQLEAAMANPNADPVRIAKLQEIVNNLKGR